MTPSSSFTTRRSWVTSTVVLGGAILLGGVVLPRLRPARSGLVGKQAPDFALPVLYRGAPGSRIRLSEQRGKAVVLDFWASWCAPCRAQAPILDRIARSRDPGEVLVLGVNTDDDRAHALSFAKQIDLSYASVQDESGSVAASFGVRQLPTVVVVDPLGRVSAVRARVVSEKEVARLVDDALTTSSSG